MKKMSLSILLSMVAFAILFCMGAGASAQAAVKYEWKVAHLASDHPWSIALKNLVKNWPRDTIMNLKIN